jgi:hypothetical protein
VAVSIPNIEVEAQPRGRTPKAHLNATYILARFQLKITNVTHFDAADKLIVLLLLFSYCPGGA